MRRVGGLITALVELFCAQQQCVVTAFFNYSRARLLPDFKI